MRDYRSLEIWQLGVKLVKACYRVTAEFPKDEVYGLTSQIRRAAVSIPANIAEGVGRESDSELLRFLRVALGSLNELETLFEIAKELGFLREVQAREIEPMMRDLGVRARNFARKLETDLGQRQGNS